MLLRCLSLGALPLLMHELRVEGAEQEIGVGVGEVENPLPLWVDGYGDVARPVPLADIVCWTRPDPRAGVVNPVRAAENGAFEGGHGADRDIEALEKSGCVAFEALEHLGLRCVEVGAADEIDRVEDDGEVLAGDEEEPVVALRGVDYAWVQRRYVCNRAVEEEVQPATTTPRAGCSCLSSELALPVFGDLCTVYTVLQQLHRQKPATTGFCCLQQQLHRQKPRLVASRAEIKRYRIVQAQSKSRSCEASYSEMASPHAFHRLI